MMIVNSGRFGAAVTAYRHYRVLATGSSFTALDGGYVFSVFTFSGYSSTDGTGTDQFLGKTPAASQGTATGLNDGNDATEWTSGNPSNSAQWMRIDMGPGNTTVIRSIKVLGRDPYGGGNYALPTTAKFQASDDASAWADLLSFSFVNTGTAQTFAVP